MADGDKKFLDVTGLSKFKEWLDKTFALKNELDGYMPKKVFDELKAEVEELKGKVNEGSDNFLKMWAGKKLIAEIESPTKIGEDEFAHKDITRVQLPDSITSIGAGAFYTNLLTTVNIPDSVTSMDEYAFATNLLTSVNIPYGVTSISNYAFYKNQLTSVTIPYGVTSIGESAFDDNLLTSVSIPDSVTSIGDYAFSSNPLKTVSINKKTEFSDKSFPEDAYIRYRMWD